MKRRLSIHLATRIFNTPLMIHPAKANVILRALGPRLGFEFSALPFPPGDDLDMNEDDDESYSEVFPSIALIPIQGTLVKRATGMDAMSGLTSYDSIRGAIAAAMADDNCKGILFDCDSGGGESCGMFELASYIESLRGQKPMISVVNDRCYSACYGLACAADEMYITAVGGAGSVGVYMLHCDQSGADAKDGYNYEYIFAGDRKVDWNPHEALSPIARELEQKEVDRQYAMFVAQVAKFRGVSQAAVRETQAGCIYGDAAVPLFADKVGTLEDAAAAMSSKFGANRSQITVPAPQLVPAEPTLRTVPAAAAVKYSALAPGRFIAAQLALKILIPMAFGKGKAGWADLEPDDGELLAVRRHDTKAEILGADKRTVSCCVAPYGQLSCDLGGFKEVYEAGCFGECLALDDPRALFNHNPDFVLGRKSAGTARFIEKADGLYFEADAPDTQWANDLLVSMARGDINQGSAAFFILANRWEYRGKTKVRVIENARLVEASIASFAAYESTTAQVESADASAIAAEQEQYGVTLQLLAV